MDADGLLLERLAIETHRAVSVDALFAQALAWICEHTGYVVGHACLVPSEHDEAVATSVWHSADGARYAPLRQRSRSLRFGHGEGLPGQAIATRVPVQSPDLLADPTFVRRAELAQAGLRSGFAIPVLAGDTAVAALECFSPQPGLLSDQTLRVVAVAGILLGRAIERRQARVELRKRSAQLAQAEKIAMLGSWEWTLGSNEVVWSEQLHRIYGVPESEFSGTFEGHLGRAAAEDRERIRRILEHARDSRQPFEYRERLAGSRRLLLTRGEVLFDTEGRPVRMIGVCQDITHIEEARRRELELEWEKAARQDAEDKAEELERLTRELERSNQELDQFAYVASHDLKAPLRGIANLSEWLEEDLGDKLGEDSRKHLLLLRGRVHRMESLIDGLLEYSRVGRKHIEPEPVCVPQLLDEIIDLLGPADGIEIQRAPCLPTLLAPRIPLQQVFHNLIGNALKHARVPWLRIVIDVSDDRRFFTFSVADNGPGIAPEYHDRIWQIFQTLEARDKVEGAGIGLALVKKIVERHGGTVGLDSQPGQGARFYFCWPKEWRRSA